MVKNSIFFVLYALGFDFIFISCPIRKRKCLLLSFLSTEQRRKHEAIKKFRIPDCSSRAGLSYPARVSTNQIASFTVVIIDSSFHEHFNLVETYTRAL